MEDVATLVAELEGRGIRFHADGIGVRFESDDAVLQPGDPGVLSELVLERTQETLVFLARRGRPSTFGAFAGVFRAVLYRICAPPGMLVWLRDRCPALHRELTVVWPDAVQRLWEDGADVEEFERAVRRLEEAHAQALGFFTACHEGEE